MTEPTNCIHQPAGLCPACQEERETDYTAWLEFGDHAQGIRNWEALQAEIAEEAARRPSEVRHDDTVPF